MTTEFVILMSLVLFILTGSILNRESGVKATFAKSGPILAARVEKHLEIGRDFAAASTSLTQPIGWRKPPQSDGGKP